jgi:hypothetical protein
MIINYLFAVNSVFSWVIVPILKDINVLNFLTNGVYISRHDTFDEHVFPAKDIYSSTPPQQDCPSTISHTELTSKFLSLPPTSNLSTPISPAVNTSTDISPQDSSSSLSLSVPPILSLSPIVPESPHHMPEIFAPAEYIPSPSPDISFTTQPSLKCFSLPSRMITRSITGSLKPKQLSDFHLYHSTKILSKLFILSSFLLNQLPLHMPQRANIGEML